MGAWSWGKLTARRRTREKKERRKGHEATCEMEQGDKNAAEIGADLSRQLELEVDGRVVHVRITPFGVSSDPATSRQ